MNLGEKNNPIIELQKVEVELQNGEIIFLDIPKTVYPPREDSALLIDYLETLEPNGVAMEIGCGSGILSIVLAKNNWKVEACDINPYAIAAAKKNSASASVQNNIIFREGGLGEEKFSIPKGTTLLFWNLPYLNPPLPNEPRLDWIEEASMSDLEKKGWGHQLADYLEINKRYLEPDLLVVLLQRRHPKSPSNKEYWLNQGWSHRVIKSIWIHDEKLELVAYWKPGQGIPMKIIEECFSTMDEAKKLPNFGWQRIRTNKQIRGRGRRESTWVSDEQDLLATWNIEKSILGNVKPGILQIIIGTKISDLLDQYCKWPNDILDKNGGKIGGILIEMDNREEHLRIGIGINYLAKQIGGMEVIGWGEKTPEITTNNISEMIDAILSTLFEEHELLTHDLSPDILKRDSWRGLSKLLSRGYSLKIKEKKSRIVGLNGDGGLSTLIEGEKSQHQSIDELTWLF